MNTPKWIIVHNSAVSREKNPEQFDSINNYHKSKGWGMIGYHYLLEPNGIIKKGRAENQVGAHCYQEGMNYNSIGICLTGYFDIEEPTKEQKEALADLVKELQKKYKIPDENVVGHRHFAPKTCPGTNIPDDIVKWLKTDLTDEEWCRKHLREADWDKLIKISPELPTAFRALALRGKGWWNSNS